MNRRVIRLGAAVLLTLWIAGCETDGGVGARIQEKSAVYATLKPWQKNYIDKGVVATGFTPDMVYMAVGNPSSVKTVDSAEGNAELWTYKNFYPSVEASKMRYSLSTEEGLLASTSTIFQHQTKQEILATQGGHDLPSIGATGGPQGGSIEPADMQSFTFLILFRDGKVTKIGLQPN